MLKEHQQLLEQIRAARDTALELKKNGQQMDGILRGLWTAENGARSRTEYFQEQEARPKRAAAPRAAAAPDSQKLKEVTK